MLPWLLCLALLLLLLLLKLHLLRRGMREIAGQVSARLSEDSNNLIFLSSRDRALRQLAAELNVQVDMKFSWEYGASFSDSPELQTMISGWYGAGTEVVFACGGSMFQSITAAASANDGKVIGVDVDQSSQSDTVITSAMKGLSDAVQWAVAKVYDDSFAEIGGESTSLGVKENAVALPIDTWSLANYTVDDYKELYQKVLDGTLVVDNDYSKMEGAEYSNLTLDII